MKALYFASLLYLLTFSAFAQTLPIDPDTKLISYSEVVSVDGISKDELFTRASEWFARSYRSAEAVLQMNDREAGKLVGKPVMGVYVPALGKQYDIGVVRYLITVSCKDGRYKYEITNFVHDAAGIQTNSVGPLEKEKTGYMSPNNKQWQTIKTQTDEKVKLLVADLKEAMAKASKKEDW